MAVAGYSTYPQGKPKKPESQHPQSQCSMTIAGFSSVQLLSHVRLCDPSMPGLPAHHQLLEFTQTHVHWVGDAIQPSHPLLSPSPPAFNLSQHQGLFKWVSSSNQVTKYWRFSFNINQSFQWILRTDLYDGLVRSPCSPRDSQESSLTPQFKSINFFWRSAFFIVQISHPHMTTGKTIALTRQNFIGKVMSLLFNMLLRLVITFLPKSNRLLISWLQSPSAVILDSWVVDH